MHLQNTNLVDGDNALALLEMISTTSGSGTSLPPPAALVALAEAQQQKKHNADKVD